MNCINLKQKLDKTLYCKYKKCTIKISECNGCPYKTYKTENIKNSFYKSKNALIFQKTVQISKKSKKLAKMERDRFSLFTDDDTKCMLCGSTYQLTWNEVYRGRNRKLSMQYGLCQRLCLSCHMKYQEDANFNDMWHKKGQLEFIKNYPELDFTKIFGKNYLK